MKWEIEKVIAEETAKAKRYRVQGKFGWDYLTHKRLSHMECERSLYYAERHNQIAIWLKELKERRKAPEIVRCGECARRRTMCDGKDRCAVFNVFVDSDGYCKWAERRTE